ncbi:MAG: TonB-dependent receptor [Candidatus Omnitrophica bacterium]|nr:TonB-dependent receptor [Candidatus Omnitrophota bacterium]
MLYRKEKIFLFTLFLSIFFYSYLYANEEESFLIRITRYLRLRTHFLKESKIENSNLCSFIYNLNYLPLDLQSRSVISDIQTDFSLRGSNFEGVVVLLDNIRINDPQTAHHNSDIPLTKKDIEKIEILSPTVSSLYGPDSVGGAVNIVTEEIKKEKSIELSYGSFDTIQQLISIAEKKQNFGIRFSLENTESDGFYYDTDFKRLTTNIFSLWDFFGVKNSTFFGYQEKEFGAYDFYSPFRGFASKEWTKTYLLKSSFDLEMEDFNIKPTILWRRHFDKFMLDKTRPNWYLNHHRTDIYNYNLYLEKEFQEIIKIGCGLEYGKELIKSSRLGGRKRQHRSLHIKLQKEIENLSIDSGMKLDNYSKLNELYSGYFDLRYKIINDTFLKVAISENIGLASFTELYYVDPTTVGDENLSEEKFLNYEWGLIKKLGNHLLDINFFLRKEKDAIDWVKSKITDPLWQAKNIDSAEVKGIELHLNLIFSDLEIDSYYTYINKSKIKPSYIYKYGPNYMKHLYTILLKKELNKLDLYFGLRYKKRPLRDGWWIFDGSFRFKINKNFEFSLEGSNLFNVEYQEIEGIPQPKRSFAFRIIYNW